MMLEDMLTYQPTPSLDRPAAELLAELDDDARYFYGSMTADIARVASGVAGPPAAGAAAHTLLTALAGGPVATLGPWRALYRKVAALVAACDPRSVPADRRGELAWALSRLRRFLAENEDLADLQVLGMLERATFAATAGA